MERNPIARGHRAGGAGEGGGKSTFFAELNYAAMNYPEEAGMAASNTAHEIDSDIRSLASDPAEVAAIISAASQLNKAGNEINERSEEEDRG